MAPTRPSPPASARESPGSGDGFSPAGGEPGSVAKLARPLGHVPGIPGRYRDITSLRRRRRRDLPDYAPIPRSALGPALNDQRYYVGRVERNLYWVTDGVYQSAFLTTATA